MPAPVCVYFAAIAAQCESNPQCPHSHAYMVSQITAALSTTYFHQLMDHYGWQSVQTNNITVLLTALLFLACKATEQLRSIRDIYNAVTLQRHSSVSLEDMDKVRPPLPLRAAL